MSVVDTPTSPWGGYGERLAPGRWRRTCIFNCAEPCAAGCAPARHLGRGRTLLLASRVDPRFSYCLYVPLDYAEDDTRTYPLIVVVHGTERAAQGYRDAFADFAERHGCVILAPLFPCGVEEAGLEMHNYKFIRFHDLRFDLLLLAMVEEVGSLYRVATERFSLFGFSGGGQFAQRFCLLHPERLRAVSIGAPGWVTLLDPEREWWVGVRDVETRFVRPLDLAALRRVTVQMVVGGADVGTWDVILPEGSRYWLPGCNDAGQTRIERLRALRDSFERQGIPVRLDVVPGVGHDGFRVLEPVQEFFAETLAR